jgi:hypothetical protein
MLTYRHLARHPFVGTPEHVNNLMAHLAATGMSR